MHATTATFFRIVGFMRLFGAIAMLCAVLALAGCSSSENTVTRNIRVIAQAEVNGKIVEGSAVMGTRWTSDGKKHGRMYIKTNAEAVALELPNLGTVYIINAYMTDNRRTNGNYWAFQILDSFGMKANGKLGDFPKLRALEGRYPVRPIGGNAKLLPLMVAFRDEAKRETLFEVKPADFPRLFGSNVRFKGMWFEFTDDAPTDSGFRDRLPVMWKANPSYRETFPLRDASGKLIPGVDKGFPQKVAPGDFYRRGY